MPSGSLLFSRDAGRYLSNTEDGLSDVLPAEDEYFSRRDDLLSDSGLFALTSSDDALPECNRLLSVSLVPVMV